MTENNLTVSPIAHRFDIKQLLTFIFQPKRGMARLAAEEKPVWLMPMLVVSGMF